MFLKFVAVIMLTISSIGEAAPLFVFMAKNHSSDPNYKRDRYCGIHENRVVVKTIVEGVNIVKESPISFDAAEIDLMRNRVLRLSQVTPTNGQGVPQYFSTQLVGFDVNGVEVVIAETRDHFQSYRNGSDYRPVLRLINEICKMNGLQGSILF